MLRGSGIEWDLRKKQPYDVYDKWTSTCRWACNGDTYDRYLCASRKCASPTASSSSAWTGCAKNPGPVITDNLQGGAALARRHEVQHGRADPPLQALHRRLPRARRRGPMPPSSTPKGEFGIYVVSDGANKPYRLKIRAPVCPPGALDEMAAGHMIADAVAMIGTMDIVFGEIDR